MSFLPHGVSQSKHSEKWWFDGRPEVAWDQVESFFHVTFSHVYSRYVVSF